MNEIETTIDRSAEWCKSVELMQGLFPKWQTSNVQMASWKERFGMLNPVWFREALHLTYHTYNSDNPKPKWVVECFHQVQAGHRGVPLGESESAAMKLQQEQMEQESHEQQVVADRENAAAILAQWTDVEKYKWAKKFTERFGCFAERNNIKEATTWSHSFAQFVVCFRRVCERQSN